MADVSSYLKNNLSKVFLAPNTSDQKVIEKAKMKLVENGIMEDIIQINYNTQELDEGNLYVSYEPPDLVVRIVYDKKANGLVKMKSAEIIRLS